MFADLPPPPERMPSLWGESLADRLARLFAKPRRVAWIYRAPDTSTFRYRVANMVAALNSLESSDMSGAWFSDSELDAIRHLVPRLDLVVAARYHASAPLQRFLDQARHHHVPLVFDVDDLVFDPALTPLVMDAVGENREMFARWQTWYAYTAQLHATALVCRSGLTTGVALQAQLGRLYPEEGVDVIPNFLDREQDAYSRRLLEAKRASGWARTGPVTIGYFSGSPTHAHDFAVAAPAVARLLRQDPEVRLRVVGSLDVVGDLAGLAEQIEVVPFMDYLSLQRSIAEVEVNIAPLQHHEFTACKSELKYFEAAAVGTWTVASETPAFVTSIDPGITGGLARAHQWDVELARAVDLARHPARYGQLLEATAEGVFRRYGWNAQATELEAVLARRRRPLSMR